MLAYGALALLGVGLIAHTFFPRYDWKTVDQQNSISIVVYDKWTGRFQRGVYSDAGSLSLMGVFTPF